MCLCIPIFMIFVPPALLFLFSATFLAVWRLDRARYHLLLFAMAFGATGLAILVQLMQVPGDAGHNALLSALLYISGMLLFGEGVLARSGERLPRTFHLAILLGITSAIGYFFYIERDLTMRIYVLNFGMGFILLYTSWRARFLLHGSGTDQALFWMVLLVALHFFPRTLLPITHSATDSAESFSASPFWSWTLASLSMLGVGAGLGLLLVLGNDILNSLRKERDSDPMTGLLNRRGLAAHADSWMPALRRADQTCVVLCDIDHFKSINDAFGHGAGDAVLIGFARLLQRTARRKDLVARLGGEEFVVLLRDCSGDKAVAFAERLRHAIQESRFEALPAGRRVTCSFGVAELRQGESLWVAIERADQNLYAAKRAGRNQTVAQGVACVPA